MTKKNVKLERLTAECLLDLPEGTTIIDIRVEGDMIHLQLETEINFPEDGTLVYEGDGDGSIALVGAN